MIDATGTIKFGVEKIKGKTVYFVRVAGPDTSALGTICDEIRIAQIRLQCAPPVNKTKEDRPEWSKLIGKKELQRLLAPISRNTLNSRLIEGDIFAKGKIRYQAAKGARKIQVAVNDLPTDLQGRFRKSAKQ